MARGVFFLCDDYSSDMGIAFLNSFRELEPELDLCLIPFSKRFRRIACLSSAYKFSIIDADLGQYDRIALQFHNQSMGHYRKLSVWSGPFDEFIYIDIDTIVLNPIAFGFNYLNKFDFIAGHSNIPGSRKWTWKDSAYEFSGLGGAEIDFAANTGFFISRTGIWQQRRLQEQISRATAIREHMALVGEQSLINYLVVTSGRPYTSLRELATKNPELNLPHERWAGDSKWRILSGDDSNYEGERKRVLFVHWAGLWRPSRIRTLFCKICWLLHIKGGPKNVRRDLPLKDIWSKFGKGANAVKYG